MSLLRRWLDPIRSRWYYQQPHRQETLSVDGGLAIYLRLDDVYSYLAVQTLAQLDDILSDELRPLKIIISDQMSEPPNGMSLEAWQQYCFQDAKILAKQHRFAFDEFPEAPQAEALAQAQSILRLTPLRGQEFLYLLEDIFHMLWQQQYGKLRTLYALVTQRHQAAEYPERIFTDQPVLVSYFEWAERKYHAVDDLLRLTRRLKQQKLLKGNPIFLINHIEWREHLMTDMEELTEIQALHPELDLYIALEDPISWLLLAYIKTQLADYYNIQLRIFPLSYQKRDFFDWSLASRLSKRAEVAFTPFCRPDAAAVEQIAQLFFSLEEEDRVEGLYEILQAVWRRGKDLSYAPHVNALKQKLALDHLISIDEAQQHLAEHDEIAQHKAQPNLPILELRIAEQTYTFNSLYRVWMIESIFSNVLEEKYQQDAEAEKAASR